MTAVGSRPIVPRNQAIGCSSTTPKVILVTTLLCVLLHTATGFVVSGSTADATRCSRCCSSPRVHRLRTNASKNSDGGEGSASSEDDEEEEDEYDYEYEREPALCSDVRGRPAGVVLEDLNWRIEKLRLEEANKRRFLKSGPRFLPYEECQKWVQAWGNRWESAEEWCVRQHESGETDGVAAVRDCPGNQCCNASMHRVVVIDLFVITYPDFFRRWIPARSCPFGGVQQERLDCLRRKTKCVHSLSTRRILQAHRRLDLVGKWPVCCFLGEDHS